MPNIWYGIGGLAGLILLLTSLRVLKEYERAVVFRLGRFNAVKGPGFVLLLPFWIDRIEKISTRTIVQDVTPQDVITKDNVSVSVNAVLWFRVIDPERAVIEVEDFSFAIGNFAQTTLRSVLGQAELDDLLSEREKLNQNLEETIRKHSQDWGIKVLGVEIKHVDLPVEMKRAMAKQAEAELESASTLSKAAKILSTDPTSIQLRYLQAMIEVSAEKNSTLVFPVPVDLVSALVPRDRPASENL